MWRGLGLFRGKQKAYVCRLIRLNIEDSVSYVVHRHSVVFRICFSCFCFIRMPTPQHSDHCVHIHHRSHFNASSCYDNDGYVYVHAKSCYHSVGYVYTLNIMQRKIKTSRKHSLLIPTTAFAPRSWNQLQSAVTECLDTR